MTLKKASKETKLPMANHRSRLDHVLDGHGPKVTSTKARGARKAHSSHIWPTSETWPKCNPAGSHLTSSHVWPMSKTWPKRDQPRPLPKLTQTNFEQARSCLNILKISSQAHTPSSQ
ncbi:hypothetical protein PIB30_104049, partial [Stylosanthes scabra]|nr:hypothetical protein [Stylosanthes scabra]